MRFDAVVRAGRAVLGEAGSVECDIGITDGRIAALLAPNSGADAETAIDARGLHVLPGVIDAHVHFGLGSPQDWDTESQAAARGGVTTVLNFIQDARSYLEVMPEELERARTSVIDYGIHFILMNDVQVDEIGTYSSDLGVPSYKYFTNFKGQEGAYLGVEGTDAGFFFKLCRKVARHPETVLVVHTENIEVVWQLAKELKAEGRDGLPAWTESRPDFVEADAMGSALLFAERTGARMYIPHVSSAAALEVFRVHSRRGGRSYIETCPHYLTLTMDSEKGSLAKVNPPLRTQADVEALWAAIGDGTVSVVGSDHSSRRRARKEGSIWTASAGFPGVMTLLPLLLSEGHHKRGLPLERIVQLVSTNPARIFGMYPRKGSLGIGSDADLTLVDLERRMTVDSSSFGSYADYSIYDGWDVKGWPVGTIVRGELVMRDNEIRVAPGHGRFVSRPADVHATDGNAAGA